MILHTSQGWVPVTILTSVLPADIVKRSTDWRSVMTVDAVMVCHSEASEARILMQVAWQKQ